MQRKSITKKPSLSVERLEKRDMFSGDEAAFIGVGSLTYSFAPDGTHVGRQVSQLHSKFDQVAQETVWQQAFARAFQKWSKISNINFGQVEDNGAASGVYGPTRGDERFGDIRITGFDFGTETSAEAVDGDSRAVGTWAGDIVFNTATDWQTVDRIEAAALHEIGHILGLGHSTDPASPMFKHGPSGALELTSADIQNVQAMHGPRALDSNEGSQGNETIGRASRIKGSEDDNTVAEGFRGDQIWLQFGDLHNATDRDVYEIRTAVGYTGPLAVEVRTAGLSLAQLKVELTDRNGNVLATAAGTTGISTLVLSQTTSEGKYYLQVHAGDDAFWTTGDYSVTIASPSMLNANAASIADYARNAHRWYFDSDRLKDGYSLHLGTAVGTQPESDDEHSDDSQVGSSIMPIVLTTASRTVYRVVGTISDLTDVDYYQVETPKVLNGHNEMVVSLESLGVAGLVPDVQVFDSSGALLATEMRVHGYGQTELVLKNVQPEKKLFIKLDASSVADQFKTGSFSLHVTLAAPSTPPELLVAGTLNKDNTVVEHEWYIARPQLVGLSLEGIASTVNAVGQVWVSIYDANRNLVTGLVAPLNAMRSAPGVFLDAGTYYFQVAATADYVQSSDVNFRLTAERPSSPVGPVIGPTKVQPLFLCPGSTTVYCYPNSTVPTTTTQQVGPPPVVTLPAPSTRVVAPPPDAWFWTNNFLPTNPTNPLDVNGDSSVDPLDVLIIINAINLYGIGPVPPPPQFVGYLDANANGAVEPLDVLMVINQLNRLV